MNHKHLIRCGGLTLGVLALALAAGCNSWDGHFDFIGYTTRPMYDTGIRTVRVPIFRNMTLVQGLEFELTEAVIREIEAKTPYKVKQEAGYADTELIGTIVNTTKAVTNVNQLGETRSA